MCSDDQIHIKLVLDTRPSLHTTISFYFFAFSLFLSWYLLRPYFSKGTKYLKAWICGKKAEEHPQRQDPLCIFHEVIEPYFVWVSYNFQILYSCRIFCQCFNDIYFSSMYAFMYVDWNYIIKGLLVFHSLYKLLVESSY